MQDAGVAYLGVLPPLKSLDNFILECTVMDMSL